MLKTDLRSYKIKKKTAYFLIVLKYSMYMIDQLNTMMLSA